MTLTGNMPLPRVMATVTPRLCTPLMLRSLTEAGMEGVRINSAHVNPSQIETMVRTLRDVAPDIVILMDTKGPEIRTTSPLETIVVEKGCSYTFSPGMDASTTENIFVRIGSFGPYLSPGNTLLVDDGALTFEVVEVRDEIVVARALVSGEIDAAKTVAVPSVELPPLPAVSQLDRINLEAALKVGIDIVAHSFVRSASDVKVLREVVGDAPVAVFSKIECRSAISNLDEIISCSDGILVARGDLGTAIDVVEIPSLQNIIIKKCRHIGLPTIVATQILQSMMSLPVPTRAEMSDIALATMQRVSWLLLTGETAKGSYPVQCVEVMRRAIAAASTMTL